MSDRRGERRVIKRERKREREGWESKEGGMGERGERAREREREREICGECVALRRIQASHHCIAGIVKAQQNACTELPKLERGPFTAATSRDRNG